MSMVRLALALNADRKRLKRTFDDDSAGCGFDLLSAAI